MPHTVLLDENWNTTGGKRGGTGVKKTNDSLRELEHNNNNNVFGCPNSLG